MIQLIARCMAFHSVFLKIKLKFKMWFLLYLSIKLWFQVILGCVNAFRTQEFKWHSKLVRGQFKFLEISSASSSIVKNYVFKGRNWARPSNEETPHDRRSGWSVLWQIGASNWWSSDREWRVEMRFHCMKKKCVAFDCPLDLNPTIAMSWGIHRSQ